MLGGLLHRAKSAKRPVPGKQHSGSAESEPELAHQPRAAAWPPPLTLLRRWCMHVCKGVSPTALF